LAYPNNIKFVHYKQDGICLCIKLNQDSDSDNGHIICISAAVKSKKDKQYVKAKGRSLAYQRLLVGDYVEVIPPRINGKLYRKEEFFYSLINDGMLSFTGKTGIEKTIYP